MSDRPDSKQQGRFWAIVGTLVMAAGAALLATWLVSVLLVKLGVSGMVHLVALMFVMPVSFGVVAVVIARKLLLK